MVKAKKYKVVRLSDYFDIKAEDKIVDALEKVANQYTIVRELERKGELYFIVETQGEK